jgi:hypothetical protein
MSPFSTPSLFEILPSGSKFRVEPHPGTIEGRQSTRYWLTEVADAARAPEDQPISHNIFTLQRVGPDYLRLTQDAVSGETGHPPVILHISYCAFIGV